MKILCPYTHLEPRTRTALDASGLAFWLVKIDGDTGYFDLMARLWADRADFAIVEHDIVVSRDALDDLESCPEPWCGQPYQLLGSLYYGLGCARFRSEFCEKYPDVITEVGTMHDHWHTHKHWCRVDGWLTRVLNERGEFIHRHDIVVEHLNPKPTHGCLT